MTLRCDNCGGEVEFIESNGAEYPETRIERYECLHCDIEQTVVLTA